MAVEKILSGTPAELVFADEHDIEDFVSGLEKYERGEIGPDAFRAFRLNRGIYGQRQSDVNMIRVKVPLGIVTPTALYSLADIAETYSRGFAHITTRQNFQLHFVQLSTVPEAMRRLAEAGLTTKESCGNTVRTVVACPHAGLLPEEPFDVTPYGQAITRYFLRNPICQNLPRKFKISLSSCKEDCVKGAINDIGLYARIKDGRRGFRMVGAGGLSTSPQSAILIEDFCPVEEVLAACEALFRLFDRDGNRENKARARMKYIVKKVGQERFLALYREERAKIRAEGRELHPISAPDEVTPLSPPRVEKRPAPEDPAYLRFLLTNVRPQRQAGYRLVTIWLKLGDVTGVQMRALAEIAGKFGEGALRTSIDQNLLLRFVPEENLPALYQSLREFGLADAGAGTIEDVTSCPGAESCNLAVTASRELARAISQKLATSGGTAARAASDLEIKISGCPNSCGQHHIAGIGFHGGLKKVNKDAAPVYQLHLGGGLDEGQATFGRQPIKIPARRVPDAVIRLLRVYEAERGAGERARDFFRRIEEAKVKGLLKDLADLESAAVSPDDYRDLGSEMPFQVNTGEGECAA